MCDLRTTSSNTSYPLQFIKAKEDNVILSFLYQNPFGSLFQRFAISRPITVSMGAFYNSKFSKTIISKYIQKNKIDMKEYVKKDYTSFNDFFTRKKKNIVFSSKKSDFCSPCDGYLSVFPITLDRTFLVKGVTYTLFDLLHNHTFAKKFDGGFCYIFRLAPHNYHRYHYFDDGVFVMKKKISGLYHTVRSVALEKKPVFLENQREYSILSTKNFGEVLYMEVGALAVGKILNHDKKTFLRGEEKGMFLFGGSTIILLFQKGILKEDERLLKNSSEGYEAVVQCGCIVGERK